MPRERRGRTDVPSTIERSDKHAQEIYTKAHDSAVESYGEGERAHRTAFSALKHSYKKVDDHWEKKARKGPSDPQAARGPETRPSSRARPARTAGGKIALMDRSRDELYEQAKRLDVKGRSTMNKEELAVAVQEAKR
jgi:cation transport regulator ChaB